MKTFKLDRATSAELLDQRFAPRKDFDPQAYFDNSIGIFRNKKPARFRIHVDPERADLAVETFSHPKKRVEAHEDGSVTIDIEAAYEEEILPRVLELSPYAKLLRPTSSRKKLAEIARKMAATHRD